MHDRQIGQTRHRDRPVEEGPRFHVDDAERAGEWRSDAAIREVGAGPLHGGFGAFKRCAGAFQTGLGGHIAVRKLGHAAQLLARLAQRGLGVGQVGLRGAVVQLHEQIARRDGLAGRDRDGGDTARGLGHQFDRAHRHERAHGRDAVFDGHALGLGHADARRRAFPSGLGAGRTL